jgi:hypothetical protein
LPTIHGGTFISAKNVNNEYRHGETGINIIHRVVALEALHDSVDSFPQPKCHPNTREKMLDKMWEYVTVAEPPKKILWVHGPAGAGKSAMMWSLCERLQSAGRLGGTFFFKRGHPTRGNAKALFSTIAYRIALRVSCLKSPISQVVENDPSLVAGTPEVQFRRLILEPCQSAMSGEPVILIIDGLDECDGHQMQQEILRILGNCFSQYRNSVRIILASRPEAHISEMTCAGDFQPLNVTGSFEDVRRYLMDEFSRIHRTHQTMAYIPSPWPSSDEVETLVDKSSGHFIYPSTVIKFVDDPNYRPTERLALVLGTRTDPEPDSPFGALDELYTQILNSVPKHKRLIDILHVVVHFRWRFSACEIDQLLEIEPGDTVLALRGLCSLLVKGSDMTCVQDPDTWTRIGWNHASFMDYLRSPTRAGKFYIGGLARDMTLARSIVNALSYEDEGQHVAWFVQHMVYSFRIHVRFFF